jgi:hypothetical protein
VVEFTTGSRGERGTREEKTVTRYNNNNNNNNNTDTAGCLDLESA